LVFIFVKRKVEPFTSSYYKIWFTLGCADLIALVDGWLLRFSYLGWLTIETPFDEYGLAACAFSDAFFVNKLQIWKLNKC
jgi:hypothetical protein